MRAIALRIGSIIGMPVMVAIWLLLIGPMLAIGGMYRWSDAGLVILPLLGVAAIGSRIVARRGLAVGLTGLAVMWVFSLFEPDWPAVIGAGDQLAAQARQMSDILSVLVYGFAVALGLIWVMVSRNTDTAMTAEDHHSDISVPLASAPDRAGLIIVACSKDGLLIDILDPDTLWPGLHVGALAHDVLINHCGDPLGAGHDQLASGHMVRVQTLHIDDTDIFVMVVEPFAGGTSEAAIQTGSTLLRRDDPEAAVAMLQFAGLGHDLRSPLSTVLGLARAMESGTLGTLPHAYADYPGMILDRGQTMLRLIDNMLICIRPDSGTLDLELQEVSLVASAQAARQAFDAEAARAGVRLTFDAGPGGSIVADPFALQRMWANLIANAISVSKAGDAIHLAVHRHGDTAGLSVQDNGPGLDPAALRRMTEPFQKGGQRAWHSGSGLGLAITALLAGQQGGVLNVTNHQAGGAIFSIMFPLAPSDDRVESVKHV